MSNGMLNFQQMPKEASDPANKVAPGRHRLRIKASVVELTSANKKALIVTNVVAGRERPEIKDWFVCFNANGEPEHFGQYKLGQLLEATNTIPQGEFSLEVLPTLLDGKEYYGVLVEEKGSDDKMYLKIAHPDAPGNFEQVEAAQTAAPTNEPQVSPEVRAEIGKDSIL